MSLGTHAIKVKVPESKRWEFLTPTGGMTHLRIHAGTAEEAAANRTVARLEADNPRSSVQGGAVPMTSPVYFGPDGCGTCGRKVNGGRSSGAGDHADWCEDARFCLTYPQSRRGSLFRALLPDSRRLREVSDRLRFDRRSA